ncbi:hypothetical protein GDO78_012506 [Eleutherodactylus coqui]|uniref:Uncharacterized protein n=1 Tax=Eleutherodactylus coqui TaxID=57060 RepID=A0A8J6EZA4_ELECQ|nr:hypothetical protein GDO78_012506 [Eleutherodactylus coqui]
MSYMMLRIKRNAFRIRGHETHLSSEDLCTKIRLAALQLSLNLNLVRMPFMVQQNSLKEGMAYHTILRQMSRLCYICGHF